MCVCICVCGHQCLVFFQKAEQPCEGGGVRMEVCMIVSVPLECFVFLLHKAEEAIGKVAAHRFVIIGGNVTHEAHLMTWHVSWKTSDVKNGRKEKERKAI